MGDLIRGGFDDPPVYAFHFLYHEVGKFHPPVTPEGLRRLYMPHLVRPHDHALVYVYHISMYVTAVQSADLTTAQGAESSQENCYLQFFAFHVLKQGFYILIGRRV